MKKKTVTIKDVKVLANPGEIITFVDGNMVITKTIVDIVTVEDLELQKLEVLVHGQRRGNGIYKNILTCSAICNGLQFA